MRCKVYFQSKKPHFHGRILEGIMPACPNCRKRDMVESGYKDSKMKKEGIK
jgi:hypothetical protein